MDLKAAQVFFKVAKKSVSLLRELLWKSGYPDEKWEWSLFKSMSSGYASLTLMS